MNVTWRARVAAGGYEPAALLHVPKKSRGLVVFARASGSAVPGGGGDTIQRVLERAGIATLLFDLLTPAEARPAERGTDVGLELELLADRLEIVTHAILYDSETRHLTVGYFGEGVGAPVSLIAAARHARSIHAVVACGDLPDIGEERLQRVLAPTLLVAGGEDALGLELAVGAFRLLETKKRLEVVPGVGHRFDEPWARERLADLAAGWFVEHLAPAEHVWAEELGGWLS